MNWAAKRVNYQWKNKCIVSFFIAKYSLWTVACNYQNMWIEGGQLSLCYVGFTGHTIESLRFVLMMSKIDLCV